MYSTPKMLKRILAYSKKYIVQMILALVFAVLYVSQTLYAPMIIGNEGIVLFQNMETFSQEALYKVICKLILVILVGTISGWIMSYVLNRVTYNIIKDLRIDAFNKILNVPVSYLDSHLHGDTLTRVITDTDQVADGLLQGFSQLFTGVITIVVTIVFMLITRWQMALVVILLTPLSMGAAVFISKRSYKTFKEQAQVKGEMGAFLNEMISEQKVVIAYSMQEKNNASFKEMDKRLYTSGAKAQFNSSLANPTTRFVNAIVYAIVATTGAISIAENPSVMTVGKLYVFLSYASQYTKPFNEISGVATELSNSFASLRRVFELIDEEEVPCEEQKPVFDGIEGNIEFHNVDFSYVSEKPLIENLSFRANDGMKIAIVGPTGCGKTTLINLLMRFYDINGGKITLDGKNINEYQRKSLRENIGMVLQETWLFKGTVFENISYAKENATKEEVIKAAKLAYADDFINRLPNGYDTIISDDEGVSVGQKQLLCIARLMLRLPEILILDEATSNIDTRTEIMVQKAFNKMMQNRTSFIIAHRLSTIRNADLILVLKDGHILEQGTHESLLEQGGFYKTLYYSQFEA